MPGRVTLNPARQLLCTRVENKVVRAVDQGRTRSFDGTRQHPAFGVGADAMQHHNIMVDRNCRSADPGNVRPVPACGQRLGQMPAAIPGDGMLQRNTGDEQDAH